MTECTHCSSHAHAEIDLTQAPLPGNKRRLFFFVGETHEDWPRYSHGVRQAVLQLNTTPGKLAMHSTWTGNVQCGCLQGTAPLQAHTLATLLLLHVHTCSGTHSLHVPCDVLMAKHPHMPCWALLALLASDPLPAADAATYAQQLCILSQCAGCCRICRAPYNRSSKAEP